MAPCEIVGRQVVSARQSGRQKRAAIGIRHPEAAPFFLRKGVSVGSMVSRRQRRHGGRLPGPALATEEDGVCTCMPYEAGR